MAAYHPGGRGFQVRPYSDFDRRGKLLKATIPIRESDAFASIYLYPTREIRWFQYRLGGDRTPPHYRALTPNYGVCWQLDSDAALSLGSFEVSSWFERRGGRMPELRKLKDLVFRDPPSLVIQIGNRPAPPKALPRSPAAPCRAARGARCNYRECPQVS